MMKEEKKVDLKRNIRFFTQEDPIGKIIYERLEKL